MKKREYEELQAKVKELQEQLDNAEIENDNPFDVKDEEGALLNDIGYSICKSFNWANAEKDKYIPCKDKSIVEARQRRHKLSDLLERFAYEKDAVVTKEMWEDEDVEKWYINYWHVWDKYVANSNFTAQELSTIHFTSKEVAEQAIKEIVEPFMKGEI